MLALIALSLAYSDLRMEGWTVRVERDLLASKEWTQVRRELESQLYRIARIVPDGPLAKLRKVTIWVHRNDPVTACMAYHPSADWLKQHKANPDMAKGVEIGNASNFLSWTYEQPWMVLHELAHAYHDRFLPDGYENKEVRDRYDAMIASKRYESILHWDGNRVKHYAMNNPMEFFAESTEAYFGQNDFYPFVNAELKTYDPETYTFITEIWGPAQKRR